MRGGRERGRQQLPCRDGGDVVLCLEGRKGICQVEKASGFPGGGEQCEPSPDLLNRLVSNSLLDEGGRPPGIASHPEEFAGNGFCSD